jgi:hypothetical protein
MVNTYRDRRDRVVVGFTTAYGISDGEVYHIQHFMIKFVSDIREVVGFLPKLQFPPQITLIATI